MFRKDISVSRSVKNVIRDALLEVTRRRHDLLTVEHLLFALTKNIQGRDLIENSGAQIEPLRAYLEGFFQNEMEPSSQPIKFDIPQTDGVQRVIERVVQFVRRAGRNQVEVPDLLVSIFDEDNSYAQYYLRRLGMDRLSLITNIAESSSRGSNDRSDEEGGAGKDDPLAEFTVDLTARAEEGKIDPLVGRDKELDRAIEVLCRRRKNNPLFVGDPGVGKTALAEGLAMRIAEGNVPEMFKAMRIYSLDMGTALAGTRYRGDFEQRLKSIVDALKKLPNAILFIDEIHTLVGAGATTGCLKPA